MKKTLLFALLLPGCALYQGIDSGTRTANLAPPSPYAAIIPPGASTVAVQAVKDTPSPVQRTAFAPPPQMVSFTTLRQQGQSDGIHVYLAKKGREFGPVVVFPVTNQFSLPLDTNTPTMVEARSFVNLNPPVVQTFTNGDGSTVSVTNTFTEISDADLVYVPTNCPSIGLFAMSNGLVLAGWNAWTNLTVQSSPDLVNWRAMATVKNLGAFQVPVDSSAGQRWFRTSIAP